MSRYALYGIYNFVWISLLSYHIHCHPRFGFIHFIVSCVLFFTLIHGNNSSIRMDFLGGALIDRFVYVTNCYKFLVLSLSLSLLWGTVFFWQKRLHYNAEDRYDLTFQYSFVKHSKYYTSLINQLFSFTSIMLFLQCVQCPKIIAI